MSGPALKKLNAHRSIHDGVISEGRNLMEKFLELYNNNQIKQARMVTDELTEHWETRAIAHADAEEEGFYQEKLDQKPDLLEKINMLKRDHELLRILLKEIKQLIPRDETHTDVIDRFKAMQLLMQIHNREEEKYLLSDH
ncbi:hemerythrin domain-containing protein [Chengkuizengella sediminis]|uniref:hemerythrin domain-containing protein n=1 Tax=Chengkuizengella sediminis TaxID=1885917 RepID=UPI00138A3318|nr:hemerythrin domain-containing protein [Chengkuizengella sediminis]NDI35222.1 hemerythrin domain-containing protein [Chengkuizengella sediminis]